MDIKSWKFILPNPDLECALEIFLLRGLSVPMPHGAAVKPICVLTLPRKIRQAILHHSNNIKTDLRPNFRMGDLEYHPEHLTRWAGTLKEVHPLLSQDVDEAKAKWISEYQQYLIKLQDELL